MKYFNRVCVVDISPNIRVEKLRIKFEIKKTIIANTNYCRVDIYNLSQTTRNRITSDSTSLVRVLAGYSNYNGLIEIGQGNISNVIHSYKSPDVITTILSKDGFNSIINNRISLSFIDKTPLSSIINTIISKLNIPVKYVNYNKSIQIKNGFSYVGAITDVLDQLGRQYSFKWSIQDGQLLILNGEQGTGNQNVFLSAKTGLIESPELIIKTKKLQELKKNEYKVTCLMQPQLQVGDFIQIESKTLNGTFIVNELLHIGDTEGNEWYTKLIVVNK
jgi:hypothetical protein